MGALMLATSDPERLAGELPGSDAKSSTKAGIRGADGQSALTPDRTRDVGAAAKGSPANHRTSSHRQLSPIT